MHHTDHLGHIALSFYRKYAENHNCFLR